MKRLTGLLLCFLAALGAWPSGGTGAAAEATANGSDRIPIPMETCQAVRRGLFGEKIPLVKRGVVTVEGKKYTLYLPKAKAYTVRNSQKEDHVFANTSTRLSIDQKGDGNLTEADHWFANLPVRLGDHMFDVAEIAADGSRIVLKPSRSPLRGVVVGRSCPPFSFPTTDGKTVSRDRLAGKPFLLDIWSVT